MDWVLDDGKELSFILLGMKQKCHFLKKVLQYERYAQKYLRYKIRCLAFALKIFQ